MQNGLFFETVNVWERDYWFEIVQKETWFICSSPTQKSTNYEGTAAKGDLRK